MRTKLITILLTLTISLSFSQTDVIYLLDGDSITNIKITTINKNSVWYSKNEAHTQVIFENIDKFKKDGKVFFNKKEFKLRTVSILSILSLRKNERKFRKKIEQKGYVLSNIYTLPPVGFLFIYISKTVYLVK